jgi:hypothetical protein
LSRKRPDKGAHNPDLVGGDTEFLRDAVLEPVYELAGLVDRQLVVVPDTGGGEKFDGVVVLGRRLVFGLEGHLGRGNRRVGIARFRKLLGALIDFARVLFRNAR